MDEKKQANQGVPKMNARLNIIPEFWRGMWPPHHSKPSVREPKERLNSGDEVREVAP
jgi:hypothetical protein